MSKKKTTKKKVAKKTAPAIIPDDLDEDLPPEGKTEFVQPALVKKKVKVTHADLMRKQGFRRQQ